VATSTICAPVVHKRSRILFIFTVDPLPTKLQLKIYDYELTCCNCIIRTIVYVMLRRDELTRKIRKPHKFIPFHSKLLTKNLTDSV